MSFLKNWKLILASLTLAMFTACAGSSGGSGENAADGGNDAAAAAQPQKEQIDENKLKKTEEEAMGITEENHNLRKEIFDAKNKLGMPVDRPAAE